jgi:beta-N-acetylglucosaminidase
MMKNQRFDLLKICQLSSKTNYNVLKENQKKIILVLEGLLQEGKILHSFQLSKFSKTKVEVDLQICALHKSNIFQLLKIPNQQPIHNLKLSTIIIDNTQCHMH